MNPLKPWLDDPQVTDLCLNGPHELYIDRGSGLEPVTAYSGFQSESLYRDFVLQQLSESGKTWDAKHPFVDAVFFGTHRAHVAFPPLSTCGIAVSLRRLPRASACDKSKIDSSALQREAIQRWHQSFMAFSILIEAVQNHESIVFAGGTGSGKTTLLNDLMSFIPSYERVITIEDTPEIASPHAHTLGLLTRPPNPDGFGGVTQRDLFRQTLRMRPDRILVGECRGDEVLDFLQALNSGHRGFMATVHANSARESLKRLELLALIAARGTISSTLIQELLAQGVQLLVHLERGPNGRRITSIHRIQGREREVILTRPLFSSEPAAAHPRAPEPTAIRPEAPKAPLRTSH